MKIESAEELASRLLGYSSMDEPLTGDVIDAAELIRSDRRRVLEMATATLNWRGQYDSADMVRALIEEVCK